MVTSQTSPSSTPSGRTQPGRATTLLGALAGLLAGAAGMAASEAVTALLSGVTGPLISVGNRAIDLTPRWLKEFAIEQFGTNDKIVLISGMIATIGLIATVLGAIGVRRPKIALSGFAVLVVVAGAAAITDRAATAGVLPRLLPVVTLAVVAFGALVVLLDRLGAGVLPARASDDREADPQAERGVSRRGFFAAAGATAVVAVVGGVVSQAFGGLQAVASRAGIKLPTAAKPIAEPAAGTMFDLKGISDFITKNDDFYRIDTALTVPDVPVDGWRLRIHGMVDKELDISFADLLERDLVEKRITLTCVSNPVGGDLLGNAKWLGVPLAELLAEAGVQSGADAVKSTSADGWTAGTPLNALTDDRGSMLAIGMNGEPLPLEHGFPARMVVPGLYGYVSATKWLVDLEVTKFSDFEAYWTPRGYAEEAPIKLASRFDVPRSFAKLEAGKNVAGGVAWAQTVGVAKVEMRVGDGEWAEAELATEDSIDTWRQWRMEWDATPGLNRLEVRVTDKDGNVQVEERTEIFPDGATGWDSVQVTVA